MMIFWLLVLVLVGVGLLKQCFKCPNLYVRTCLESVY